MKELNIDEFAERIYEPTMDLICETVDTCAEHHESAYALIGTVLQMYLEMVTDVLVTGDFRKHTAESKDVALTIAKDLVKHIAGKEAITENHGAVEAIAEFEQRLYNARKGKANE